MNNLNVRLALLQLALIAAAAFASGFYFDHALHRPIEIKYSCTPLHNVPSDLTTL